MIREIYSAYRPFTIKLVILSLISSQVKEVKLECWNIASHSDGHKEIGILYILGIFLFDTKHEITAKLNYYPQQPNLVLITLPLKQIAIGMV